MPAGVDGMGREALRRARIGLLAIVIACAPTHVSAQMRMTMGAGVAIALPGGFVAVLGGDSTGVTVQTVVAAGEGSGGRALLMEGDRILTVQGGGVTSLDAWTTTYATIPQGTEVVLGVRRGGGETTVRFARPASETESRSMVVQRPGGGAGAWTAMGPPGGGPSEMSIAGARIRNNAQGMPEVVLRGSDAAASLVPLRVGDVIVSVNGRPISALAGLELFYAPLAPGDQVEFEVERDGAHTTVRFAKPAGR